MSVIYWTRLIESHTLQAREGQGSGHVKRGVQDSLLYSFEVYEVFVLL